MKRLARGALGAGLMLMSVGVFPALGAPVNDALQECPLGPARQSLCLALGAPPSALSLPVGRTPVPPPPDPATLRRLIAESPEGLGSLSIGEPDNGALLGSQRLSHGPLWRVRNPAEAWATSETLAYLQVAIEAVEAELPGSPPLLVGDLSRRGGGPLKRHLSHQNGRDVDLGWYFTDGQASHFRIASAGNLDLPRCWALLRALLTRTEVEYVFMDAAIQRLLFSYALGRGEDREWLLGIFGSPGGRSETFVQHEPRHRDHLHVRFRNPRAQAWGRAAYPHLVEAGLALPPSVVHRARPGDTLGALARRFGTTVAAIRHANGLRSSLIRAGHRYRIPTRFAGAR